MLQVFKISNTLPTECLGSWEHYVGILESECNYTISLSHQQKVIQLTGWLSPSPVEMHLQACVLEEWTAFCVNLNLQSSWQQPQSIQKQLSALITASSSPLRRQISVSHTTTHLPCSNYSLTSLNFSISVHIQMHRPQIASILLLQDHTQKGVRHSHLPFRSVKQ